MHSDTLSIKLKSLMKDTLHLRTDEVIRSVSDTKIKW